ncbi:hypothetical protein Scep_019648 [Stephania cephalantha]|uniref:Uncharacterized protein n=1 Tax=Stephania cephalantha TaxID=152367 RepID=A0AAP0IB21_9MAGN
MERSSKEKILENVSGGLIEVGGLFSLEPRHIFSYTIYLLSHIPTNPNQLTLPSTPPTKSSSTLPSFNSPGPNKLHSSYPSTEPEVTTPDWLHWCGSSLHLQLQIRTATHPNSICVYNSIPRQRQPPSSIGGTVRFHSLKRGPQFRGERHLLVRHMFLSQPLKAFFKGKWLSAPYP